MRKNPISIVIPTWNGKELLRVHLGSVVRACDFYPADTEIIVVDDGSFDGTDRYIRETHPSVKVLNLQKNVGFAKACNTGVKKSRYGIVVILNNDMRVKEDFLIYFSEHFSDKSVFGVLPATPRQYNEPHKDQYKIRFGVELKYGLIETPMAKLVDTSENIESAYTFKMSGGASVIDKSKFALLNGFDELFYPFYWEDVDLSYRAWKRGWKILYEPRSVAYHRAHGTINPDNFKSAYIEVISERNRYILIWKNITDRWMLLKHFSFIPVRLFNSLLIKRSANSFRSLIEAVQLLPQIYQKRRVERNYSTISDGQLLQIFRPYRGS